VSGSSNHNARAVLSRRAAVVPTHTSSRALQAAQTAELPAECLSFWLGTTHERQRCVRRPGGRGPFAFRCFRSW
jgi:hypothetical protein